MFLKSKYLMKNIKHGVSFRNDQVVELSKPENFDKIVAHFGGYGFYYDEIKSLSLMRPEDRMIMIFIKGKP